MSDSDANQGLLAKFRSRYLLKLTAVGIVVLLVIAGVGFTSVSSADNELRSDTQSDLTSLSDIQARTVNQWATNTRRQMSLIADAREMESTDPQDIRSFLNEQMGEGNSSASQVRGMGQEVLDIHYIYAGIQSDLGADQPPEIRHSSNEDLIGVNPANASPAWLNVTFEGDSTEEKARQVRITEPYQNEWYDQETVAVLTPVNVERANQLRYRIVLVISTERAATDMLEAPGDDGRAFVTNNQGTVMFSTDQEMVGQSINDVGANTGGLTGMGTNEPQYVDELQLFGNQQAVGVAPVTSMSDQWTVAASQPQSTAFALAQSIQNNILILIGVVLLAFLVFFTLISRGAIADIREISREAQLVADNYEADVQLDTTRNDEIGDLVRAVDRMQSSLNEQITDRIEELERLNTRMASAVDHQSDVMDDCAEGDLSRRMDPETGVDQLDSLAASFNAMMDDIQASIREALSFSYTVASASEQAAAAASESKQASELVSEATQEISHGTDRQSEELAATVQEMSSFSASIEEVASSAHQLSNRSNDAADTADEGREAAQQAVSQLETIESETDQVVESFEALREEAQEIERIVDFIGDVAEQTNMLALNANIEASRAGSGEGDEEGFGVVAREIKELANDTQEAAGDIEDRLTAIQDRTEETSSNIFDAQSSIQEGTETIQEALEALDSIAEAVQDVDVSVQEINDVVEDQSETAQQVVTRVEEVSDIAERNADQAEDVAAAAEEQTVTVDEISSTVDELSSQATQLADLLDQFSVDTAASAESIATDDD